MDDETRLQSLLAYQPLIQSGPFLSGVIHDLNNGIGAVIAYADLIGMGSYTREELDKMLDDLVSAAKRIAELSDAVATATRDTASKKSAVSVAKLVEHVLLVCEYRFQSRGVRLDVSVGGNLERSVVCYGNELARALIYLLLNALENCQDAPRKEVELEATISADEVVFRVRDRGAPITPDDFETLLKPYATTKPAPHLGLGLTAAAAIAGLHDGQLGYVPETGVILTIPLPPD